MEATESGKWLQGSGCQVLNWRMSEVSDFVCLLSSDSTFRSFVESGGMNPS